MPHRCLRPWITAVLLLLTPGSLRATTILVPGDQPTIQAAVDAAGTGDVVMLVDQVYTGDGNHDVDFHGKAITIRSGSGDPLSCIIDCQADDNDPHRGFLFQSGETTSSVLQGVTIRHGYDSVNSSHNGLGGGIYCTASPYIVDCRIDSCFAAGVWTSDGFGGAVHCGGSPVFERCTFVENLADDEGGAVSVVGTPVFTDCIFQDNDSIWGGAVTLSGSGSIFVGCLFLSNDTSGFGGAIYIHSGAHSFVNCRFEENSTWPNSGSEGGAVWADIGATAAFSGCDFIGNHGSYAGGAVSCKDASFTDCLFADNVVDDGPSGYGGNGGAYAGWGTVSFLSCTLAGNSGKVGSAIHVLGTTNLDLQQTIICDGLRSEAVHGMSGAAATAGCCDVHGNAGGDWFGVLAGLEGTDGNFSADPQFCGVAGSRLYKLQSDSPCAPDHSDCGLLIGARPVGCGTTPAFLAEVSLRAVGRTVVASWRTVDPGVAIDFRLTGRAGGTTWAVPMASPAPGCYEAVDDAPRRGGSGTVAYSLQMPGADGWRLLHDEELTLPAVAPGVRLAGIYPNPFNPRTTIAFALDRAQRIRVTVCDLSGRCVKILADGPREAGSHEMEWDGRDAGGARVASGGYLVLLEGECGRDSRRILLLK
jgi:hypothetical protein